jgi:hypothetical protein
LAQPTGYFQQWWPIVEVMFVTGVQFHSL